MTEKAVDDKNGQDSEQNVRSRQLHEMLCTKLHRVHDVQERRRKKGGRKGVWVCLKKTQAPDFVLTTTSLTHSLFSNANPQQVAMYRILNFMFEVVSNRSVCFESGFTPNPCPDSINRTLFLDPLLVGFVKYVYVIDVWSSW